MAVQYPIRAVSRITGIPIDTLRAWERRYGAVKPERGERGRLYGEAEVRRLSLLREAVERGHAIGQIAGLSEPELNELIAEVRFGRREPDAMPAPGGLGPVLQAVAAYDYDATNEELGRLALLMNPAELVHRAVLPLMRTAGEMWERGTFRVAQEHMLSECVRNLLGGLLRRQTEAAVERMLFTTPVGEQHEFGILAAAMLAARRPFRVTYLGPNLPAAEIRFVAASMRIGVIVLGLMEGNATAAVREEIGWLAGELPGTEIWIGGSGRSVAAGLGANVIPVEDMTEFERRLERRQSRNP